MTNPQEWFWEDMQKNSHLHRTLEDSWEEFQDWLFVQPEDRLYGPGPRSQCCPLTEFVKNKTGEDFLYLTYYDRLPEWARNYMKEFDDETEIIMKCLHSQGLEFSATQENALAALERTKLRG